MKTIKCNGKTIRITSKMVAMKDGVLGKILVCESCPYANETCGECKDCYGKVILSEIDIFDTKLGDFVQSKLILRDKFTEKNKSVVAKLEATDYINSCDIISVSDEDKRESVGSMNSPWIYTDRPNTWKTDCQTCKEKYKIKKDLTPCQKATKYYEDNGINLRIATTNQIIGLELPEECVCREQKQRICKFF